MSVAAGWYIITNVKQQRNVAFVGEAIEGGPLTGVSRTDSAGEIWRIENLGSEHYTMQNVGNDFYANAGNQAKEGDFVEGRNQEQEWKIRETRVKGRFTISSTDSRVMWRLTNNQRRTPIDLIKETSGTNEQWWWKFEPITEMQQLIACLLSGRWNAVFELEKITDQLALTAFGAKAIPALMHLIRAEGPTLDHLRSVCRTFAQICVSTKAAKATALAEKAENSLTPLLGHSDMEVQSAAAYAVSCFVEATSKVDWGIMINLLARHLSESNSTVQGRAACSLGNIYSISPKVRRYSIERHQNTAEPGYQVQCLLALVDVDDQLISRAVARVLSVINVEAEWKVYSILSCAVKHLVGLLDTEDQQTVLYACKALVLLCSVETAKIKAREGGVCPILVEKLSREGVDDGVRTAAEALLLICKDHTVALDAVQPQTVTGKIESQPAAQSPTNNFTAPFLLNTGVAVSFNGNTNGTVLAFLGTVTLRYPNGQDLTGYHTFSGTLGAGSFSITLTKYGGTAAADTLIAGAVVGGPAQKLSFNGSGSWS